MAEEKVRRRIAAAKHWDKHGIDESDGEEVDVQVEAPLSVTLSINLDAKRYASLKRIAKKRKMPVTSVAKNILIKALDEPHD